MLIHKFLHPCQTAGPAKRGRVSDNSDKEISHFEMTYEMGSWSCSLVEHRYWWEFRARTAESKSHVDQWVEITHEGFSLLQYRHQESKREDLEIHFHRWQRSAVHSWCRTGHHHRCSQRVMRSWQWYKPLITDATGQLTCSTRARYWPLGRLFGKVKVKDCWSKKKVSLPTSITKVPQLTFWWEAKLAIWQNWRYLINFEPALASTSLSGVSSGISLGQIDREVLRSKRQY